RLFAPVPKHARLPRLAAAGTCRRCGQVMLLGSKLWAVLVEVAGEFCHVVPQAYDPGTRQFIDIETGARLGHPFADVNASLGNLWVCPSGATFVGGGTTGTFATGALGPWHGLSFGGCLGGGWFFGGE